MLEARIVAASTHRRDLSEQGALALPALITASSHGCFIRIWMLAGPQRIPDWV